MTAVLLPAVGDFLHKGGLGVRLIREAVLSEPPAGVEEVDTEVRVLALHRLKNETRG